MVSGSILIDPERDREFHRDGFTVVRLLQDYEITEVHQAIESLQQEFGIGNRSGDDDQKFRVSYYDADMGYQRAVAGLVRSLFAPRLARVVTGYKVAAGGTFSKAPGAGEMGVHSDFTATPFPDEVTFTVWCPLADADEANGTLCMVPKSHKVVGQIMGPEVKPFYADYREKVREKSFPICVKAGEALIFRTGMIHWSLANRSDRARPAVHCLGIPEGSSHAIYLLDQGTGGVRFDIRDLSATGVYDPSESLPHIAFCENKNRPVPWAEMERILGRRKWWQTLKHRVKALTSSGSQNRR